MPQVQTTTTYLQMTDPGDLRPAWSEHPDLHFLHVAACPPWFYRDLYRAVGRSYNWHARYHWTDDQILANLADPAVTLHVLYAAGDPAGFAELHRANDETELRYVGLLPLYLGRGLGRHLVTAASDRAWQSAPRRVWLHTCTLDHPAALPAYLGRGFRPYDTLIQHEPKLEI